MDDKPVSSKVDPYMESAIGLQEGEETKGEYFNNFDNAAREADKDISSRDKEIGELMRYLRESWIDLNIWIKVALIVVVAAYVWFVFGGDSNVYVSIENWEPNGENECQSCNKESEPPAVIQTPMQTQSNPSAVQSEELRPRSTNHTISPTGD